MLRPRVRAGSRFVLFTGWMVSAYGGFLAGRLLCWTAGSRRGWRNWCFRTWARGACRIAGVEVEVEGVPPAAPFLLVSNHLGYLDIIVYATLHPGRFVAKREVASWPLLGRITRSLGTVFIDRERSRDVVRVGSAMSECLAAGEGLMVFPEGTSTGGEHVLPFRPSLLEVAAREELPVYPVAIVYQTPAGAPSAREAVCWWGDMPFLSHAMGLLALPRIEARVRFGAEPVMHPDRKQLARRLRDEVLRLYKQAYEGWVWPMKRNAVDANIGIVQQGIDLLRDLDDPQYVEGEPSLGVNGVGAHLRHCIEFYEEFLGGLAGGRIDYAARRRDRRIETDRAYALQRLLDIVENLGALPEGVESRLFEVNADERNAQAAGDDATWAQSDGLRELGFLTSHTVHHFALIALVLRAKGRDMPDSFGVAPSTLAYEREVESCAQ